MHTVDECVANVRLLVNQINMRFIQYLSPIMHYKFAVKRAKKERTRFVNAVFSFKQSRSRNNLKKCIQSVHSMGCFFLMLFDSLQCLDCRSRQFADLLNYVEHFMVILKSANVHFIYLGLACGLARQPKEKTHNISCGECARAHIFHKQKINCIHL